MSNYSTSAFSSSFFFYFFTFKYFSFSSFCFFNWETLSFYYFSCFNKPEVEDFLILMFYLTRSFFTYFPPFFVEWFYLALLFNFGKPIFLFAFLILILTKLILFFNNIYLFIWFFQFKFSNNVKKRKISENKI